MAVFLDISKAFDKVLHDGLLFKLRSYGISGCLFSVLEDFLDNRQQRVVLNGKKFKLVPCNSWCASRLCPRSLIFLIYINDLVDSVSSEAKLYADDTSLFTVVYDADKLNRDLDIISNWAHQ